MENTETINQTEWQGNFADMKEEVVVETPIFIIFAEYLGYVSRFNQLAVDWCNGDVPEPYVQKIMMMEAKSIFRQMKKDYTIPTIRYWYDTYYQVILCDFVENLSKVVEKE